MYPLILQRFDALKENDHENGNTYYALNIGDLSELLELDALCRVTNEHYLGVKVSGMELTLLETVYEFERTL